MLNFLDHLNNKTKDLGITIRKKLKDKPFTFEMLEIDYFTRSDDEVFIVCSDYIYNNVKYNVTLFLNIQQVNRIAVDVGMLDDEISDYLYDEIRKPFKQMCNLYIPKRKTIVVLLTAHLDLKNEDDYKRLDTDDPFLPFVVSEVNAVSLKE